MKKIITVLSAILMSLAFPCQGNVPPGFIWIDPATDSATMEKVHQALQNDSVSSIRKVGVEDGFALVMTAYREIEAPMKDYDPWNIYNVSLRTGEKHLLVSGFGVDMNWVGRNDNELAIKYYSCAACATTTLFTTLHFTKGVGWQARWQNDTQTTEYPQPGALALDSNEGDLGSKIEQVFAVVSQPNHGFAVGTWYHAQNAKTHKIIDDVRRYSIDPNTGIERSEHLLGQAALNWERAICTPSNFVIPGIGQNLKMCRIVLNQPFSRK